MESINIKETYIKPGNFVMKLLLRFMSARRGRGFLLKKLISWFPKWNQARLVFEHVEVPLDLRNDSDIGYFYGQGLIHEKFYQEVLIALCHPDTVLYDIGANLGYYSILISPSIKKCYAFEPNPLLIKRLRRILDENELNNIELFNVGVSNRTGEMIFYYNDSRHDLGSFMPTQQIRQTALTKADTLDHLIAEKGLLIPDIIKVDTEGTELDILEGYTTMETHKPAIFIEWLLNLEQNIQKEKIDRLTQILNKEYEIYVIANDEPIIMPWRENVNLPSSNLLLMHREDIRHKKIGKWIKQ